MSGSGVDVPAEISRLRHEIAGLFEGLDPGSWDTPSWCRGWRVRDVLGHLVHNAEATGLSVARDVLRHGGRADLALDLAARRLGDEPVGVLAARLRAASARRFRVIGFPEAVGLGDLLVHRCDAFRPLGVDTAADPPSVVMVLDSYRRVGPVLFRSAPLRRATLVATDLDWRGGRGPEVRGRGVDLMMLMANRKQVVPSLEGPGLASLGA